MKNKKTNIIRYLMQENLCDSMRKKKLLIYITVIIISSDWNKL